MTSVDDFSHDQGHNNVFVAFKRAPLAHTREGNELVSRFQRGGAFGVVAEVALQLNATYLASAISPDEIECAQAHPDGVTVDAGSSEPLRVQFVRHDDEVGQTTQNYFFSEVLWPAMHDLWERWRTPVFDESLPVAWQRYKQFLCDYEQTFTNLSADSRNPAYLLHDYQLIGLPAVLRNSHPESRIGLFYHCAWSGPDSWSVLPGDIAPTLVRSMCASNWIGFYSDTWAHNFLACVERFVPEAVVDRRAKSIRIGEHMCAITVLALGYSPDALQDLDTELPADVDAWVGDAPLVVTYGRTDPNKNLARTVEAFRRAVLGDNKLRETKLLLRLAPHNLGIEIVERCYEGIQAAITRARGSLGDDAIMVIEENSMAATLASYKRADVLLFVPMADGQNLSPFEGIMVNTRNAGVVLSSMMGAAQSLRDVVSVVNPYDVDAQAAAIRNELLKTQVERAKEFAARRAVAEKLTVHQWIEGQVAGLFGTSEVH